MELKIKNYTDIPISKWKQTQGKLHSLYQTNASFISIYLLLSILYVVNSATDESVQMSDVWNTSVSLTIFSIPVLKPR